MLIIEMSFSSLLMNVKLLPDHFCLELASRHFHSLSRMGYTVFPGPTWKGPSLAYLGTRPIWQAMLRCSGR